MNRLDRLLAILLYLQSRRVTRAEDVAGKFNITIRTAYRDLAALGDAGVPLTAEGGVGYSILKGFHLQPVTFTPDEAGALALGGLLVQQFAGSAFTEHMSSALLKIRAVLPQLVRDHMEVLEQSMRPVVVPKSDVSGCAAPKSGVGGSLSSQPSTLNNLVVIQDALAKRQVLRFRYRGAGRTDTTAREVEPMAVIIYLQHWHLFAWDRSKLDYRDFRTDRIRGLELTGEKFSARKNFRLEEHIDRLINPKQTVTARVRATHLAAERIRREAFLGVFDERVTDGAIELTLKAVNRDWLVNWLLSFGTAVTILSPPEIQRHLSQTAAAVSAHHS